MVGDLDGRQPRLGDCVERRLLPALRLGGHIRRVDRQRLLELVGRADQERKRVALLARLVREAPVERDARHDRDVLVQRADLVGVQFGELHPVARQRRVVVAAATATALEVFRSDRPDFDLVIAGGRQPVQPLRAFGVEDVELRRVLQRIARLLEAAVVERHREGRDAGAVPDAVELHRREVEPRQVGDGRPGHELGLGRRRVARPAEECPPLGRERALARQRHRIAGGHHRLLPDVALAGHLLDPVPLDFADAARGVDDGVADAHAGRADDQIADDQATGDEDDAGGGVVGPPLKQIARLVLHLDRRRQPEAVGGEERGDEVVALQRLPLVDAGRAHDRLHDGAVALHVGGDQLHQVPGSLALGVLVKLPLRIQRQPVGRGHATALDAVGLVDDQVRVAGLLVDFVRHRAPDGVQAAGEVAPAEEDVALADRLQ